MGTLFCVNCNGTGLVPSVGGIPPGPIQIACAECGGTGKEPVAAFLGRIRYHVEPSVSRFPTHLILDNTDAAEYLALSADLKAAYALYISAGVLDMNPGTQSRNLILGYCFPPGKITNTAIMALLSSLPA